jgi:hypothetical protein
MAEEQEFYREKVVKPTFEGESDLPVHYVNAVNVRSGVEEFFITLGTATPPEITDIKDLESLDTVKAHVLFRFAMSRHIMKDVIGLLQRLYDQQARQIEMTRIIQEKGGEDDDERHSSRIL